MNLDGIESTFRETLEKLRSIKCDFHGEAGKAQIYKVYFIDRSELFHLDRSDIGMAL
jgi:hypothetical protein